MCISLAFLSGFLSSSLSFTLCAFIAHSQAILGRFTGSPLYSCGIISAFTLTAGIDSDPSVPLRFFAAVYKPQSQPTVDILEHQQIKNAGADQKTAAKLQ